MTSVATASLMFGDILWTVLLLGKLASTAVRPFQQSSFVKSILLYWIIVCVVVALFAYAMYTYSNWGYLQFVPICLVPSGGAKGINPNLFLFVYLPFILVFTLNAVGICWIRRRFFFQANKSESVRRKVIRVVIQYLVFNICYTILLLIIYLTGLDIHTCWLFSSSSPPSCLSWDGFQCNASSVNRVAFNAQLTFFVLFCLRGAPELLVFLHLNRTRIIERLRDREYVRYSEDYSTSGKWRLLADSAGMQAFNFAQKFREDIMEFTQVLHCFMNWKLSMCS
jgi:hypothetical protein